MRTRKATYLRSLMSPSTSSPTLKTKSRSLLLSASRICGSTSAFGSFSWLEEARFTVKSASSEFWLDDDAEMGACILSTMDTLCIVGVARVIIEDDGCGSAEVEGKVAVTFVVAGREIEDVPGTVVAVLVVASVAIIAGVDRAGCVRVVEESFVGADDDGGDGGRVSGEERATRGVSTFRFGNCANRRASAQRDSTSAMIYDTHQRTSTSYRICRMSMFEQTSGHRREQRGELRARPSGTMRTRTSGRRAACACHPLI